MKLSDFVRTRFKELREHHKVTQSVMAAGMGMHVQAYKHIESGDTQTITTDDIDNFCAMLGIEMHEVLPNAQDSRGMYRQIIDAQRRMIRDQQNEMERLQELLLELNKA